MEIERWLVRWHTRTGGCGAVLRWRRRRIGSRDCVRTVMDKSYIGPPAMVAQVCPVLWIVPDAGRKATYDRTI